MFKTILAAYDGSDHADKAVTMAGDLAAKYGATLHLARVVDHNHAPREVAEFAAQEHVESPDRVEEHAVEERELQPLADRLHSGDLNVECVVLRGEPASALIGYANNVGADLIVMGRRGRGRMEGLVIGSVSAKLTSHANCAVLTIK